MDSTHIMLKHQISTAHSRDVLAHAERQRMIMFALAARARAHGIGIAEARIAIAASLRRTGFRLLSEPAPDERMRPENGVLKVRPGSRASPVA